jgi:hypothetical protein
MDVDHSIISKKNLKVDNVVRGIVAKQLAKKRPNVLVNVIFYFFLVKDLFKKDIVQQKEFVQDLGLLIVKNHLFFQLVENV